LNDASLLNLIQRFADLKVIVIGEAMLDTYLDGTTKRLCREAPVPVVSITHREYVPGGAANAAVNVANLGAEVAFLSVIGRDQEGDLLLKALEERGVSTATVLRDPARVTLSKNRIVAASQMVVRYDQGSIEALAPKSEHDLIERLKDLYGWCDAIIVSDYAYGILTPRLIKTLAGLQKKDPRLVMVDSRRLPEYKDMDITAIKPNFEEVVQLLGENKLNGDQPRAERILACQADIHNLCSAQIVAVTLDLEGALVFEKGRSPYRTYAKPQPHSYAAGAGDTFAGALTLALAAGAHTPAAAEIASAAAGIVVQKEGTASCFANELIEHFSIEEKYVTDAFQLAARMAYYRRHGLRIVFTNGCFDILHRGHITYLNKAKEFGDVLVVGLNSDGSIRRLKGENRPINTLEDRGQILSALSCVDHIIPFDEDTPEDLIRVIEPDVFVKGGDYTLETLPEAPLVNQLGGEVVILPYVQDHSTSGIIERIRRIYA
jgi:D-beta-D-heptose 7-phosphate kinase / D-beta-D-heptose 1-phosphate adenosyltransferase